jgi:hypothetical protein
MIVNATDLHGFIMECVEKVSGLITHCAVVENIYLTKQSALKGLLESKVSNLYLAPLKRMVKLSEYFDQVTEGWSMQFRGRLDIDIYS